MHPTLTLSAVVVSALGAATALPSLRPRDQVSHVVQQGRPQDSVARALLRLEDSWAAALVKRDTATFQRLLGDGFIYSEDDRTMTRDQVLREIVAGSDTVDAAHNEDMRVHRFGDRTAVVTGWLVLRGRGASGRFDRRYRYTDTWVNRGGRWQIVAAHDYLVPARRG